MAASPADIALMTQLKRLGVPPADYKGASTKELQSMLATRQGAKSAPARKSAPTKATARKASPPVKAKAPVKSAPGKTAARPAPGKSKAVVKPARKAAPAATKPVARKAAPKATPKPVTRRAAKPQANGNGTAGVGYTRQAIDRKSIDWRAEWAGGARGNREVVWPFVVKAKGDTAKAVESFVAAQTGQWWKRLFNGAPSESKAAATKYLMWFVNRMIFDFATQTGQHSTGTNGNGSSKPAARKPASKPATKPQARKPAASKPVARKAAAKSPARKPVAKKAPAKRR